MLEIELILEEAAQMKVQAVQAWETWAVSGQYFKEHLFCGVLIGIKLKRKSLLN